MTFFPLPCRFVGSLFNFFKYSLIVSERTVQYHPEVLGKHMLHLTRKVYSPGTGFTHVPDLHHLQTGRRRHRVTVVKNIVAYLLIDICVNIHDPAEKLSFYTEVDLLGNFPRDFIVRISRDFIFFHLLSTRRRIHNVFRFY